MNHEAPPSYCALPQAVFQEPLSADTLGTLAYFFSLGRPFTVNDIRQRFDFGTSKSYRIMRELIDAGWVVRRWLHHEGRFIGVEYIVRDNQEAADNGFTDLMKHEG